MKNKSRFQVNNSIKHTSEELPAELVELLEEDLQQVVGGLRIAAPPTREEILNQKVWQFLRRVLPRLSGLSIWY
jgi:hypothetical protein